MKCGQEVITFEEVLSDYEINNTFNFICSLCKKSSDRKTLKDLSIVKQNKIEHK